MREVISGLLWIGNAHDARDIHGIVNQGIFVVIDLAMEEPAIQFPREVTSCRFPLVDGKGNTAAMLRAAVTTTADFLQARVPLLVACSGGMSRAPAIAAAALAIAEGVALDEAIPRVANHGPADVSNKLWSEIKAACHQYLADGTATAFRDATIDALQANKRLADRAIEQLPDDKLHLALDPHTNSIAVIMKHVAGNLISRWTDFLTTDGEKPDRHRDDEFVDSFASRDELLAYWERGWSCLFDALNSLARNDFSQTVTIRGEPHSVPQAIERSLGHTCYHIGQIVQAARVQADENWNTLTIPRGGSEQFNQENWGDARPPKP